jgi:hypothetical protein
VDQAAEPIPPLSLDRQPTGGAHETKCGPSAIRRREAKGTVGAVAVVVVDVDAQDALELAAKIRIQSRHSRRTVPTKRSAITFAFGARIGVRMISRPSLRNTSSKVSVNLRSRFVDQEAQRALALR